MSAEYFRGDVVGSAAEGGGGVPRPQPLLTHPVVGQFDVAVHVEEDVVQLQVSVHYPCFRGRERGEL